MKITIIEITEHEVDEQMMRGDASHEGWGAVNALYAEEYERKVDNNKWEGLPFTCNAPSIEAAIDRYNEAFCEYDYIKAVDADYETDED